MDKNLLAADLSSLSEADEARISSIVDHYQIRDRCIFVCTRSVIIIYLLILLLELVNLSYACLFNFRIHGFCINWSTKAAFNS